MGKRFACFVFCKQCLNARLASALSSSAKNLPFIFRFPSASNPAKTHVPENDRPRWIRTKVGSWSFEPQILFSRFSRKKICVRNLQLPRLALFTGHNIPGDIENDGRIWKFIWTGKLAKPLWQISSRFAGFDGRASASGGGNCFAIGFGRLVGKPFEASEIGGFTRNDSSKLQNQ